LPPWSAVEPQIFHAPLYTTLTIVRYFDLRLPTDPAASMEYDRSRGVFLIDD
jgi:hypothetical protein